MQIGYIKLWRKLEDSEIFQNEKALKIWIWILLRVNHKETNVLFGRQKIHLNKGEFIMGLNKASENLNLAKSTIHFWVNYLNHLGMVELKKTNKFTIIKVKNWDTYQGDETQTELKKNSKRTLKETDKNVKNDKNDKEIDITSSNELVRKETQIAQIDNLEVATWQCPHCLSTTCGEQQPNALNANNAKNNSTELLQTTSANPVNKIFDIFYKINPTINFANKTQRKAAQELIKQLGEDKVIRMTEFAVKAFGETYAPTITNPLELKNKLAKLAAYWIKQKTGEIKELDVSERRVL